MEAVNLYWMCGSLFIRDSLWLIQDSVFLSIEVSVWYVTEKTVSDIKRFQSFVLSLPVFAKYAIRFFTLIPYTNITSSLFLVLFTMCTVSKQLYRNMLNRQTIKCETHCSKHKNLLLIWFRPQGFHLPINHWINKWMNHESVCRHSVFYLNKQA